MTVSLLQLEDEIDKTVSYDNITFTVERQY